MVFMITYDLNKQGKDYEGVFSGIKSSSDGTWCHYWDSTWLIRTSLNAEQIYNNIAPHIDNNDRVIVVEVKNHKQGWLTEEQWKYINTQIFA